VIRAMKAKAALLRQEMMEKREKGFNMSGLQSVKLGEYNALYDPNMRHFFESKVNQNLLYRTGQIDSHGRVIDYEKNKSKLHILEREFQEAERVEEKRQQEEKEMRVMTLTVFIVLLCFTFQFGKY
jgi:regulatory protein YycI of two-component signal transduction system YycFG